jgi:hypothetical protein
VRSHLKTAVGFDIDSCLAHTEHRWGLSPMVDPDSDWTRYCAARLGDSPIRGTVTAARLHYEHRQVHLWSGSEASAEAVTRQWLDLHRVPFDGLRLRPDGDDRSNAELKISWILELRESGIETVLFYEDHPEVAADIEAKTGIPVLVVNPCYSADAHKFQQGVLDNRGGGL